MEEILNPNGQIGFKLEWDDGRVEFREVNNRILRSGRQNLVKALANDFGSSFDYFISGMSFGDGGTTGGAPRYVDDTRTGLFGTTLATKGVITSINADLPTQVTFTSVLAFDDLVGSSFNEMALRMRNGDYFSMATFGDIAKTSSMQLTLNWRISMV